MPVKLTDREAKYLHLVSEFINAAFALDADWVDSINGVDVSVNYPVGRSFDEFLTALTKWQRGLLVAADLDHMNPTIEAPNRVYTEIDGDSITLTHYNPAEEEVIKGVKDMLGFKCMSISSGFAKTGTANSTPFLIPTIAMRNCLRSMTLTFRPLAFLNSRVIGSLTFIRGRTNQK